MPNDFEVSYPAGNTLYVVAERISDAASYTNVLTDNGDGSYTGDMDTSAGRGAYICRTWRQTGALPVPDTSVDKLLNPGETKIWSGTAFNFNDSVERAVSPYRNAMNWEDNK